MPRVVFLKRASITLENGHVISGQPGNVADIEGDDLKSAISEKIVELDKTAAPAAAKSKK